MVIIEICDFIFNQHIQPLCKWFENLSTASEGPRSNSTRGLRFFALSHACDKTTKIFLDFFTKLKIYHLSFKYYLNKYWNFETINGLETLKNQGLKTMFSFLQCQCFCLYQNPYHIFIFDNILGARPLFPYTPHPGVFVAGIANILLTLHIEHVWHLSFYPYFPLKP